MPKFNDLNLEDWRECDVNVDSLWLIGERSKSGKHKNIYHRNFIPQIPYQLLTRYTKQDDVVLEPFMGSGTTLFKAKIFREGRNDLRLLNSFSSGIDLIELPRSIGFVIQKSRVPN